MPRLEKLDWSGLTGVIALHPGTRLRISNLDMGNFSLKSDYVYSPATPYQSIGSGVSIWPTINGAPNSTFVGLNITGSCKYVLCPFQLLLDHHGSPPTDWT